jgi:tripartite-type tricarboxylate transporter receptor subunit TctC
MRAIRCVALLFGLLCSAVLELAFAAEPFPSRPIKFVVGFAAGGANDTVARIMCDWLTPHLGQPCVRSKVGRRSDDRPPSPLGNSAAVVPPSLLQD